MKKNYISPEIQIIEEMIEPIMFDASVEYGGETGPGTDVDSKGSIFEEADDWNGWDLKEDLD